jgi:hypothetical protein
MSDTTSTPQRDTADEEATPNPSLRDARRGDAPKNPLTQAQRGAAPQARSRGKGKRIEISPALATWRHGVLSELHWKSKAVDHEALRDQMQVDLGAMEAKAFGAQVPVGKDQLKKANSAWNKFLDVRAAVVAMPPPRVGGSSKQMFAALSARAGDCLKELVNDASAGAEPKRKFVGATLSDLRSYELWDDFIGLGMPQAWGGQEAMKAAGIKASLDLETLPIPKAERLGGDGANPAYWIKRAGNGQQTATTSIFKPINNTALNGGVPRGGEVAREALASRTSELLSSMTGLDFGVPETHVVAISAAKVPGAQRKKKGDDKPNVVGSLQSFAATDGELRDQSVGILERVTPEACQTMAILDTVMLNMDRHTGNFMVKNGTGPAPELVPIDHGLSFPIAAGLDETFGNIANDKNALLKMPGAWREFSPKALAAIAAINVEGLKSALEVEADNLGAVHQDAPPIDPEAIAISARAAEFLKRAAPQLPPALVQIALGINADRLLDPNLDPAEFDKQAAAAISRVKGSAAALQSFFVDMTDSERQVMRERLKRNGWPIAARAALDERWMMNNLDLALRLYREDKLNTEILKELSALGWDGAKIQAVLKSPDKGLHDALKRARSESGDKPMASSWSTTEPKERTLSLAEKVFGTLPPDEIKAFELAEAFRQLGGMDALESAIDMLAPALSDERKWRKDIDSAVTAMKRADNVRKAAPKDVQTPRKAAGDQLRKVLDHINTLHLQLDPRAQPPFKKRIDDAARAIDRIDLTGEVPDAAEFRKLRAEICDDLRAATLAQCTQWEADAQTAGRPQEDIDKTLNPVRALCKQLLILEAAEAFAALPTP